MKKKLLRILPVVIILGLLVAIPASTQIFRRSATADEEGGNLALLVLVNRMELTTEQMEEIHDILAGVLAERETHESRAAELEEQMIAFDGSAEELDEILETFRLESQELAEGAQDRVAGAIDRIKEILTLKQGELLVEALPGLLGQPGRSGAVEMHGMGRGSSMERMMPLGRMQGQSDDGFQGRMLEQLEGRFEGHAEVMEGLRDRIRGVFGRSDEDEEEEVGGLRGRMGLQSDDREQMGRAMMGHSVSVVPQGRMAQQSGRMTMSRGSQGNGVIEQLVDVLELKLEAME